MHELASSTRASHFDSNACFSCRAWPASEHAGRAGKVNFQYECVHANAVGLADRPCASGARGVCRDHGVLRSRPPRRRASPYCGDRLGLGALSSQRRRSRKRPRGGHGGRSRFLRRRFIHAEGQPSCQAEVQRLRFLLLAGCHPDHGAGRSGHRGSADGVHHRRANRRPVRRRRAGPAPSKRPRVTGSG